MLMRPIDIAITNSSDSETIAVASAATVYTKAFKLPYGASFGISAKAASSGTIDVKVELEQSWKLPVNEGVTDINWVVPDGISDIWTSVSSTTQLHKAISPVIMRYARFKLTGGATNDASTTIALRFHYQEDV